MKDINLLPEDIKSTTSYAPDKPKSGVSIKAIVVLIFILMFVGASLAAPTVYTRHLETTLSKIEDEIADPKYDPVKQVKKDIAAVSGTINSKNDVMNTVDLEAYPINEVLVVVKSVVPEGCSISKMEYSGTNLGIAGQVDSNIALAELVSKIQRLDFIEIVNNVTIEKDNKFNLTLSVGRKEGN